MSLPRVAALLASLFFFSVFAIAKVSAPSCTTSVYEWTFNSLGQSPCTVTAYMIATCNSGDFTLPPLGPGDSYFVTDLNATFTSCVCNTVAYSLFSACDACQGETWYSWQHWNDECTTTLPPSSFPNPVPSGINVPHWALVDVTSENNWNPNTSYAVGDFPETGPGSILRPSGVIIPPTSTSTGLPRSGGGNSKVGAIAGGIAGGVAAVAIVIAAIFYLRRRSQAPSAGTGAPQPSLPTTIKFYDPNDPSTFPYQGGPPLQDIPYQVPMSSHIETGGTLGNTQTSPPQARGYDGRSVL